MAFGSSSRVAAVLLRQARDTYCGERSAKAFFHFYLFYLPARNGKELPLNWILSDDTAQFIWNAMDDVGTGNDEEHKSLKTIFGANDGVASTSNPR
jgi:hypothetical protein